VEHAAKSVKKSPVQAIDRAFAILGLLAKNPDGLKAVEIARLLDLNPTTVHGLLRSLGNWRAVERNVRTGVYQVGAGIYELSHAYHFESMLQEVAKPILAALSDEMSETVNLGVLRNYQILTIIEVVPDRALSAREVPGRMSLPHTQARGKVLLAFTDEVTRATFQSLYPQLTASDGTLLHWESFWAELDRVRQLGFAVATHRPDSEVLSYGVPVFDARDDVVAAIGLVIPKLRLPEIDQTAVVSAMQRAAAQIRECLGHRR